MKIQLSLSERKYIYALMKLFAHNEPTQTGKMFWAELAKRLQPNQATAYLRKKEVQLLLDIVVKAVQTIDRSIKSKASDLGQELRADALDKIMTGLRQKLEAKLASNEDEHEAGSTETSSS